MKVSYIDIKTFPVAWRIRGNLVDNLNAYATEQKMNAVSMGFIPNCALC